MTQNEVRIGNYYQVMGDIFVITSVSEYDFYGKLVKQVSGKYRGLTGKQPIELSPEILRAAGFISSFSSDPQEVGASKVFELNGFKVHQHDERENKFEAYNYNTHEMIEVNSVHQLQNLYYYSFNTGQELTINLK